MKITQSVAKKQLEELGYNLSSLNFSIEDFTYGMNVELEHGTEMGKDTNVTNDNPLKTAKIALAHMKESPEYYKELKKMEQKLEKKSNEIISVFEKKASIGEDPLTMLKLVGGAGLALSGGKAIRQQFRDGNLTGRERVYHNTDKKNVDNIKKKGILVSRSYDKDNITHQGLKGVVKVKDMNGLTYVARKKPTAQGMAIMSAYEDVRRNGTNPVKAISKRRTLKADIPAWKMEITDNPELLGTKNPKELAPMMNKRYFKNVDRNSAKGLLVKPADLLTANIVHRNLGPKSTHTIKGTVPAKYIRGSKKYEGASKEEVSEFIKNNPKRFAKGVALSGVGALMTGAGLYNASKGAKGIVDMLKSADTESDGIEKQSSAKNIVAGAAGLALLSQAPDMILGKKKVYHGTSSKNWESIKQDGFKSELGGKGVSSINKDLQKNSKKAVHVTATKPIATYHAAMSGRPDKFAVTNLRLELNNEKRRLEKIKNPSNNTTKRIRQLEAAQKALFPLNQKELTRGHFINPGKNAKVVKSKMDYNDFKNMDIDRDLPMNKFIANTFGQKGDAIAKQIAAKGAVDIPIESITGSDAALSDRYKHTLEKLPEYVRNNPTRFGAGLVSAGAGTALIAKSLKGVI